MNSHRVLVLEGMKGGPGPLFPFHTCEKCSGIIFQLIFQVIQTGTLFKKSVPVKLTYQKIFFTGTVFRGGVQFTGKVIK